MAKGQNNEAEAIELFNKAYAIYESGIHLVTLHLYDGTQVSGILQGAYFQNSDSLPVDKLPKPGTIDLDVDGVKETYSLFSIREIE